MPNTCLKVAKKEVYVMQVLFVLIILFSKELRFTIFYA